MKSNSQEAALPRYTKLDAFDPHRDNFKCRHEAQSNPPFSSESEAIFQQAQALNSFEIWPEKREYNKIAALYEQAAKLGHWKAEFNLAGLYLKGLGVQQDADKALELTEDLMRKGVPAAWDNMGAYYMGGIGPLKQSSTVAYAFWQRAADMGSASAQTYIGGKLLANHDEPPSFWGNSVVGRKMLKCALAQGSGDAALKLGVDLDTDGQYPDALNILHEGVKLGSEDSAGYLFGAFDDGDPLVKNLKDKARAERYQILADALFRNPDLRFPNLDKVLPLPPADLPMWDGDKKTLVDAAKALVPRPPAPPPQPEPEPHPASMRVGRALIPDGQALPERPQVKVAPQYEYTSAPEGGYWIARLMWPRTERHHAWNAAQVPMRYARLESFDRSRPGLLDEDGRIQFHYLGEPVAVEPRPPADVEDPRVSRGIARHADRPAPTRRCRGDAACPLTGVWSAAIPASHALAAVFNDWTRQAYVEKDRPFPDPASRYLAIERRDVRWTWLGNANALRVDGLASITLQDGAAS